MSDCLYCHDDPEGKKIGCVCGLQDDSARSRWISGYADHHSSSMPTFNKGGEPPTHPDDVAYMQGWNYLELADELDYERSVKGCRFPES